MPIVTYIAAFLYVYTQFGLKFENQYAKAKNAALLKALNNEVDENMIQKDFSFNEDTMKLSMIIKLQKLYIALWTIVVIPHFFYNQGEIGIDFYHVVNSFHPMAILIVIWRGFSMKVETIERGGLLDKKDEK